MVCHESLQSPISDSIYIGEARPNGLSEIRLLVERGIYDDIVKSRLMHMQAILDQKQLTDPWNRWGPRMAKYEHYLKSYGDKYRK